MKSAPLRLVLAIAVLLTAAGCGGKNVVVLVPDPDGTVGSISVANEGGTVVMDTANQATDIQDRETAPRPPSEIKPEAIERIFGNALAVTPPPPVHFILYFKSDSTQLTADSAGQLSTVVATIRERSARNISVVGHSDALGDRAYNLILSRQRAEAVKALLIEQGIDAAHILTSSHGEENPLIPTPDNVSQPKNRRVEVVVP